MRERSDSFKAFIDFSEATCILLQIKVQHGENLNDNVFSFRFATMASSRCDASRMLHKNLHYTFFLVSNPCGCEQTWRVEKGKKKSRLRYQPKSIQIHSNPKSSTSLIVLACDARLDWCYQSSTQEVLTCQAHNLQNNPKAFALPLAPRHDSIRL